MHCHREREALKLAAMQPSSHQEADRRLGSLERELNQQRLVVQQERQSRIGAEECLDHEASSKAIGDNRQLLSRSHDEEMGIGPHPIESRWISHSLTHSHILTNNNTTNILFAIMTESIFAIQSNPIQSNPIQSKAIQSNPIQCNPIQSNPIQCNLRYTPEYDAYLFQCPGICVIFCSVLRSSLDHSLDRLAPRAAQPSKLASSAVLAPWPATVAVDLWRRRTDQPASPPATR